MVGNVLRVVVESRSEKPDIGVTIALSSAILNVCTSSPKNVPLIKTKMKYPKTLATKFVIIFNHHLYAIFKILFFEGYPYHYVIVMSIDKFSGHILYDDIYQWWYQYTNDSENLKLEKPETNNSLYAWNIIISVCGGNIMFQSSKPHQLFNILVVLFDVYTQCIQWDFYDAYISW